MVVTQIQLQFQGGFAGKECWLELDCVSKDAGLIEKQKLKSFYPEDVNSIQISLCITRVTMFEILSPFQFFHYCISYVTMIQLLLLYYIYIF